MVNHLRHASRRLAQAPAFAASAILILATAIGLNTAAFSAVNTLLFRPLPFPQADRLVVIGERHQRDGFRSGTSLAAWRGWRGQLRTLEDLAAVQTEVSLRLGGTTRDLAVAYVTPNFFDLADPPLRAGRAIRDVDVLPSGDVAVISEALWRGPLGAAPLEHLSITIGTRRCAVIGVAAEDVRLAHARPDAWLPFPTQASSNNRGDRTVRLVGLLRPGMSADDLRVELAAQARSLEAAYPDTNSGWGTWIQTLRDFTIGERGPLASLLLAAVATVLLLACFNLATLQLSRAAARTREAAVCRALGAGAAALGAPALAEALLLAAAGGTAGIALTWAARQAAIAAVPELRDLVIDARVLTFTALASVLAAVLFGTAPAVLWARMDVTQALRTGSSTAAPGARRFRNGCVVVQVAGAVMLLVAAGVLVGAFGQLTAIDAGLRSDHVLVAELTLPSSLTRRDDDRRLVADRVEEQLAAVPAVRRVAIASSLPLFGADARRVTVHPQGEVHDAVYRAVSPDYFAVYGIPVVVGRGFVASDREGAPAVAVVSRALADRAWPGSVPIGRTLTLDGDLVTVVGVVADVRGVGLRRPVTPEVYRPLRQAPPSTLALALVTGSEPLGAAGAVRAAINAVHPAAAVSYANAMAVLLEEQVALVRWLSVVGTALALLALVLAMAGLYGTTSLAVSQRTRELGVRLALGAAPAAIARLVLAWGARLAVGGALAGVLGGLVFAHALRAILLGASPPPIAVIIVVLAIVVVANLLILGPAARRAARTDPLDALRHE